MEIKMNNNQKRILGIINAPSNKRYKNFINTVVDFEEVWLLDGGDGYCTFDVGTEVNIIVYPTKEIASFFCEGATPIAIEIHEFCEECKKLINEENIGFAVFPNNSNAVKVSAETLYEDLLAALEEIEDLWED